ncbi:bifunctional adenosylcobinamide kinase/adenosylcobinamide-phosphate guanylyltransferase [Chloroflexota bacterium]
MSTILLLGGARSGKSYYAQELASKRSGNVLFVATGIALDEEMTRRIQAHRRSRPPGWRTLEVTTGIGAKLLGNLAGFDTVIVDCITLLVNNIMMALPQASSGELKAAVTDEIEQLAACFKLGPDFIIVSNEVGLGLVPEDAASRAYRDLLGRANQMLAGAAEEVYFMAAGIPLRVKPA